MNRIILGFVAFAVTITATIAWSQPPSTDDPPSKPASFADTIMAFDKNGDGVSKDELPARLQGVLERNDGNKDGRLTRTEIEAATRSDPDNENRRRGPEAGGPGAGGRGGAGRSGAGRSGAGRGGAGRSGAGRSGPARSGPARSGPARSGPARSGPARSGPARGGPGRSGPGAPSGPANDALTAKQMVAHAMSFDADEDGKLSRSELAKFAADFVRRRLAGNRRPAGGPGANAGGPPSGERRPARPARPGG